MGSWEMRAAHGRGQSGCTSLALSQFQLFPEETHPLLLTESEARLWFTGLGTRSASSDSQTYKLAPCMLPGVSRDEKDEGSESPDLASPCCWVGEGTVVKRGSVHAPLAMRATRGMGAKLLPPQVGQSKEGKTNSKNVKSSIK